MWEGSCWSACSRAAARTYELDAGERRPIMEGEEVLSRWVVKGRPVPRCVVGGVVSQAPIRRIPPGKAGAMTMCSGAGLLSQMIERGRLAGSCRVASSPGGFGDPLGLVVVLAHRGCWPLGRRAGGRRGSAACGRLPWWRFGCRAAGRSQRRWPRTLGSVWRSELPGWAHRSHAEPCNACSSVACPASAASGIGSPKTSLTTIASCSACSPPDGSNCVAVSWTAALAAWRSARS